MFRRAWLIWAPILVGGFVTLAWAAGRWSPWEWLRDFTLAAAWVVGLGVLLWALGSVVVLSRRGFWVPFGGRGLWSDVVSRDDTVLTLRTGDRHGMDAWVSFDRVAHSDRIRRILDRHLPGPLPGLTATEPHPLWRQELEDRADSILKMTERRSIVPTHTREWLRPISDASGESWPAGGIAQYTHSLQLTFAPAANGRLVRITLNDLELHPVVEVDGLFAAQPAETHDLDLETSDNDDAVLLSLEEDARADAVALLAAVFGGGRREPVEAWRIVDGQERSWDFYPRLLE